MLTFIESPLFSKLVHDYLDDNEYAELQTFLAINPDAGKVVRGSGVSGRSAGLEREAGRAEVSG